MKFWGGRPSAIREMLHRPLYRGEIVWNKSQKVVRAGTKKQRRRDQSEWVTLPAPDLRIIPDELWQRVKARLEERAAVYLRNPLTRRLNGRTRRQDESAYLLIGFARCSVCDGPVGTDLRAHGSNGARRHVAHYACLDHKKRGNAVCVNRVGLRQDLLDRAVLDAISEVLTPTVLTSAVETALARLSRTRSQHTSRRADVEQELRQVQQRLDRLVDALADGSLPADEIKSRLNAEKTRKTALQAEASKLERLATLHHFDAAKMKDQLQAHAGDVSALLNKHTPQARQMLRKLLVGPIQLEPVGRGRQRGYKFRGALTIERLIGGQAGAFMENTSVYGGPNGIRTRD